MVLLVMFALIGGVPQWAVKDFQTERACLDQANRINTSGSNVHATCISARQT